MNGKQRNFHFDESNGAQCVLFKVFKTKQKETKLTFVIRANLIELLLGESTKLLYFTFICGSFYFVTLLMSINHASDPNEMPNENHFRGDSFGFAFIFQSKWYWPCCNRFKLIETTTKCTMSKGKCNVISFGNGMEHGEKKNPLP